MGLKSNGQKIDGSFKGKHFISISQIASREDIEILFNEADRMKALVESKSTNGDLKRCCIAELFYQPSTRTFTSFLAAARWLGALVVPVHGMSAYSSAVKGETLSDTIKSIHQTTAADLIILRHPEDESSEIAARSSYVPIINAGSGKKEHPTQAVLDLYTIRARLHKTDNLNVTMVGDLKNGRTIKSLALLLGLVSDTNKITFVSPDSLRAPLALVNKLKASGISVEEKNDLKKSLADTDVVYMTRIQKEWFADEAEYNETKNLYVLNGKMMRLLGKHSIVMHPLPRVDEISTEVDADPREAYFGQMRNGLYTRMALLKLILKGAEGSSETANLM